MNARKRMNRKIAMLDQELADFLYYLLPKAEAGQCVASIKHWRKHKGPSFIVGYLKSLRLRLLKADESQWPKLRFRSVARVLVRNLTVRRGNYHEYRAIFFKFLKTVGLFKATINKQAYLDEIERLKSRRGLAFNEDLFSSLFESFPRVHPKRDSEIRNILSTRRIFTGKDSVPGVSLSPREISTSALEIAHIVARYPKLFTFLNLTWQVAWRAPMAEGSPVGEAVLLNKDGGLKRRCIYIPHVAAQLALTPLHRALDDIAVGLPGFYAYSVESGISWVSKQTVPLYSIDLDAATDWIPLVWQVSMLHRLLGPEFRDDINLFNDISTGDFTCPGGVIKHEVGQPMGLLPSFLTFSLLLYFICRATVDPEKTINISGKARETYQPAFAVLGDDIITNDIEIYRTLCSLGLQISKTKSLFGSNAEWGGTSFIRGTALYDRRVKATDDPLNVILTRSWHVGKKLLKRRYTPKVVDLIHKIANLPQPVGLGLKPGSVAQLRLEALMALYFREEEPYIVEPRQHSVMADRLERIEAVMASVKDDLDAGFELSEVRVPQTGQRAIDLINSIKSSTAGECSLPIKPREASFQEERLLSAYKTKEERELIKAFLLKARLLHPAEVVRMPVSPSPLTTRLKKPLPSWRYVQSILDENTPIVLRSQSPKKQRHRSNIPSRDKDVTS